MFLHKIMNTQGGLWFECTHICTLTSNFVNGPFHLGYLNDFLEENYLTRNAAIMKAVIGLEFPNVDLVDSSTYGFGRMVIGNYSTESKYIDDG